MTTTTFSGSAKIYTFPPRGRFALRMSGNELSATVNMQLPRGAELTSGSSGWYHDEAIQESAEHARNAEQSRKN